MPQTEAKALPRDARLRQLELWRWRQEQERGEHPEGHALRRFAAGTSRGVANFVGAPVDIINSMLQVAGMGSDEPLGGSVNIQRGLEKIGLGVAPEADLGRAGTVGEVVGISAPGAAGIVGSGIKSAASHLPKLTRPTSVAEFESGVARAPRVTSGVVQDIALNAQTNPVSFALAEGASAVGAGLARYEAIERWPESPTAVAFAEMLGGIGPGLTVGSVRVGGKVLEKLPLTGAIVRGVRNAIGFKAGGKGRAKGRIERAVADPEALARKLDADGFLQDAPLSKPARIGEPALLSLEKDIAKQTEGLTRIRDENMAAVNKVIRQSLVDIPVDDVPTHVVREHFRNLLDTRLRLAAENVDDQLAKLGANATREDLNTLANLELRKALSASRTQETDLFARIPQRARVPTTTSREYLQELLLDIPKAQRGDIPEEARTFLNPTMRKSVKGKMKTFKNPNYLGDETNVKEMRGLSSKLRETAREARANNQFNKARIADDIANRISDDIGNAIGDTEVREAVDIAISFSKDLNDRFTRGPVARLLGRDKAGTTRVDPALTLQDTVGKRGPRAAVETDKLIDAVSRTDVPGIEGSALMREHIEGFLIDDFRRQAVFEGRINPANGRAWLADNIDTLNRFPELRNEMQKAVDAGGQFIEAERFSDPLVSRAAVFIKAPPGQEIQRVLTASDPREAMRELTRLANLDESGRALRGLKTAMYEHLLRRAEGPLDIEGARFVSGQALSEEMSRDTVLEAMRGLFTSKEFLRLERVRKTALALDAQRKAVGSVEGIIRDETPLLLRLISRFGAAAGGREIASVTGGGTVQAPGIAVAEVKKLVDAGINDPAKRLLTDALFPSKPEHETLFKALLLPQQTPGAKTIVRGRVNAWALDVLAEQQAVAEDE